MGDILENGVVKKIDELGRIVIPKDIRKNLKIHNGDVLKIAAQGDRIELVKYSETTIELGNIKKIYESFIEIYPLDIIFTDRDNIILSNLVFTSTILDESIRKIIGEREYSFTAEKKKYTFGDTSLEGYFYIYPIITSISSIGSIIIYSKDIIEPSLQNVIKFISKYIAKTIDISC